MKGRVTKEDLHGYIREKMVSQKHGTTHIKKPIDFSRWGEVELQKLTKVNRITGGRLKTAWQEIPHVTQGGTCDISDTENLRQKMKALGKEKGVKVTLLPFFMKAAVLVLKEMPRFNSSLDENDENLIIKNYFHLGIAMDTPSGLVVPSVREVDKKTIFQLSKELMDLSSRAKEKKLRPEELNGSTFTISSLGGIGGTAFSPIVNPPEVAILGVSKSEIKPVFDHGKKEFFPRLLLPFSISYDHRVIDGAMGASFVERFSEILSDLKNFEE